MRRKINLSASWVTFREIRTARDREAIWFFKKRTDLLNQGKHDFVVLEEQKVTIGLSFLKTRVNWTSKACAHREDHKSRYTEWYEKCLKTKKEMVIHHKCNIPLSFPWTRVLRVEISIFNRGRNGIELRQRFPGLPRKILYF